MINFNNRVYIESGNGTVEAVAGLSEEGYGVVCLNSCDPVPIGSSLHKRDDFDPNESEVIWVFKNVESLDVVLKTLREVRGLMIKEYPEKHIHPCHNCQTGWGMETSVGFDSCHATCEKLAEFNKEKSK